MIFVKFELIVAKHVKYVGFYPPFWSRFYRWGLIEITIRSGMRVNLMIFVKFELIVACLLYTSPSPRD